MAAIQTLCERSILLTNGKIEIDSDTNLVVEQYIGKQETKSNSVFPIINNGFKINDFRVQNIKNGNNLIRIGDSIVIKFDYENLLLQNIKSPAFMIRIKDYQGTEIVRLSTKPISGYDIDDLFDEGYVELFIEKIPLVAGVYFVDLGLASEKVEWVSKFENIFMDNFIIRDMEVSNEDIALIKIR